MKRLIIVALLVLVVGRPGLCQEQWYPGLNGGGPPVDTQEDTRPMNALPATRLFPMDGTGSTGSLGGGGLCANPSDQFCSWFSTMGQSISNTVVGYISQYAPAVLTVVALICGLVGIIALVRMAISKL